MSGSLNRCSRRRAGRLCWAVLLGIMAGCATDREALERALQAARPPADRPANLAYHVSCPDVLDLAVDGRPELSGRREVGPDGRIELTDLGRLRVEGLTLDDAARRIAAAADVDPPAVHVRVTAYQSQQIFLVGQVAGLQRALAYQGPETVLDLLQRAGGLTAGAAPNDITVVRPRVAEGLPPEVFRVDLRAIVLKKDDRTNVKLQPSDQVFVAESKQFNFEKAVPPWLKPLYESICGMRRADAKAGKADDKVTR